MEPRRDDGDDGEVARRPEVLCHAAMEPRRDDGDDTATMRRPTHSNTGRNGAPS